MFKKKLTEKDIQKKNPIKGVLRVIDDENGRHLFLDLTSDIDVEEKTIVFCLTYLDLSNCKQYSCHQGFSIVEPVSGGAY